MSKQNPISRQPKCGKCHHEEHILFDCDWCKCPPHTPTGRFEVDPKAEWLI